MSIMQLPQGMTLAQYEDKMRSIQREHHVAGRECGECNACCTVLHVVELNKPINTPCPNCTAAGCGIYETRPLSCRGWSCEWWLGRLNLTESQRPDKLGLMFTFDPNSPIIAYELTPGAASTKQAVRVLNRIKHERPLMLQPYGTQKRIPLSGDEVRAQEELRQDSLVPPPAKKAASTKINWRHNPDSSF